ncbi:hypothetical protein GGE12_004353 [Rhizobium mongolense]|uniref:Uncharacterized protein n=1 Tax=Rhizobium mongolense TaxID=57676 RepID=A0A7W6RR58_9HYPH|nr:hypothetical protein [Rhizobium mongolense]
MNGAEPTKVKMWRNIQIRKGKLEGDDDTCQEADHAPKDGGDQSIPDNLVKIGPRSGLDASSPWRKINPQQQQHCACQEAEEQDPHVGRKKLIMSGSGTNQCQESANRNQHGFSGVIHVMASKPQMTAPWTAVFLATWEQFPREGQQVVDPYQRTLQVFPLC